MPTCDRTRPGRWSWRDCRVRIGYSASAVYSGVIGAVVSAARAAHPKVELLLEEIHPSTEVDSLVSNRIDVMFGTTLGVTLSDDLVVERLVQFPIAVALPSGHRLADLHSVTTNDLKPEVFIGYAGSNDEAGLLMTSHILNFSPKVGYRAANPVMVLGLVEAGLGLAIVPSVLAQFAPNRVVYRPIADVSEHIDVSMISRRQEGEPVVREFVRLAAANAVVLKVHAGR